MKPEFIQIDKANFDFIKKILGKEIKTKCDFCKCKLNRDNFGLIAKDISSCNNLLCLIESYEKFDKNMVEKNGK